MNKQAQRFLSLKGYLGSKKTYSDKQADLEISKYIRKTYSKEALFFENIALSKYNIDHEQGEI